MSGKHVLTSCIDLQTTTDATETCRKPSFLIRNEQTKLDWRGKTNPNLSLAAQHANFSDSVSPLHVPPAPPSDVLAKLNIPNPYITESDLAKSIRFLLRTPRPTLGDPELRFDISPEVARSNLNVLQQHQYDLQKLCNRDERSSTSFGSEFRDVTELDQLFKSHPRWNRL